MELITNQDLLKFKMDLIEELKNLTNSQQKAIPEILKSSQVKEYLGCSDSKLETLRRSGKLPYQKVMGTIYYRIEDINKLISN